MGVNKSSGYLPERNIQTGIGEVAVKVSRAREEVKRILNFLLI